MDQVYPKSRFLVLKMPCLMDPNGLKAMTGHFQNPKPEFWELPIHQYIKYCLLDKYVYTTSYASGLLKIFKRRDSLSLLLS